MSGRARTVDVLICTMRRPKVVEALASLGGQVLPPDVVMRIVVVDNDDRPSAWELVKRSTTTIPVPVDYVHAPAFNISVARNAGLDVAEADWIAFFDDDQIAEPTWLGELLGCVAAHRCDGAFGPVTAVYPDGAPDWMRRADYHSTTLTPGDEIRTGYCGNAILRWRHAPWRGERFDRARGQSGEDTDFFFRLNAMGARFAYAPEARAYEAVEPERLSSRWLRRRRFRMGKAYASSVSDLGGRAVLFTTAAAKAAFCGGAALARAADPDARRFWLLRGALHIGVCSGCVSEQIAALRQHTRRVGRWLA